MDPAAHALHPAELGVHVVAWITAALIVVQLIRFIWQRSPHAGAIVMAGAAFRVVGGLALFWISLRHAPLFRELQTGGGFWLLASDALVYYGQAMRGATHGLAAISAGTPSPMFSRALAVALRLFGATPVSAVALNVVAYAACCAMVVAMWPAARGAQSRSRIVALCALSFAPVLLLSATQPLKDQFFVLLVVAAAFSARGLAGAGHIRLSRVASLLALVALQAAAIYAISGIRAYFGLFTLAAVAAVMTLGVAAVPLRRWPLQLGAAALTVVVSWQAFLLGAGPYAARYQPAVHQLLALRFEFAALSAARLETAREGFVNAGGATNLVELDRQNSLSDKIHGEALGLMALVLPTPALKRLPGVTFSGGHGLSAIADCDTLFLDTCVVMQLWFALGFWRKARPDPIFLSYCLLLAALVALPMAYVVTNYGTLLRLRLMYVVPLLLCGAALPGASPLGRWLRPEAGRENAS